MAGNKAYYTCTCGKWYEDGTALVEITDKDSVVIPKLGHDYTEEIKDEAHLVPGTGANCQSEKVYYFDCEYCDEKAQQHGTVETMVTIMYLQHG